MSEIFSRELGQLEEMGFSREDATSALEKYGNLERAANYLAESDGLVNDSNSSYDNPTAHNDTSFSNDPDNDSTSNQNGTNDYNTDTRVSGDDCNDPEPMDTQQGNHDPSQMALIPYKNDYPPYQTEDPYQRTLRENSTWPSWIDPENPLERMRSHNIPIGLRPSREFNFPPCIFQALFHIPVFRITLLSFRPTRDDWGSVEGYWKGVPPSWLDDSMDSNHHKDFKFIHEVQKLFAFMFLSERSYVDCSFAVEALSFQDRNSWDDSFGTTSDFIQAMLAGLCTIEKLRTKESQQLASFWGLFGNTLTGPEFKDVSILKLEFSSSTNTIYSALDQFMDRHNYEESQKFFHQLANILVVTLKLNNNYNSFSTYGSPRFQLHKELFMDRYMFENRVEIERRWNLIRDLNSKLQEINYSIESITNFENHDGQDLIKGSIEHFRRKSEDIFSGDIDENERATKTQIFLERFLEGVERKLKDLLTQTEEIQNRLNTVFETHDMQKNRYLLRAVLIHDGQFGQGHHWAYVWIPISKENLEESSGIIEDGSWWKFQDACVAKVTEEQVFEDDSGVNFNAGIFSLIYLNDELSEIDDTNVLKDHIPKSLLDFIEADNKTFFKEIEDYSQRPPEYSTVGPRTDDPWQSDSTINGASLETPYCSARVDPIEDEARRVESCDPMFLQRFELFCAKLGRKELVQILLDYYADPEKTGMGASWSDPISLLPQYRNDPKLEAIVEAYDGFKNTTRWITEGLEEMLSDAYTNALEHFIHALKLEKEWIQNTDKHGQAQELSRVDFILYCGRICLEIINSSALKKVQDPLLMAEGLEDALKVLEKFLRLAPQHDDKLLKQFQEEWLNFSEKNDTKLQGETSEKLCKLVDAYGSQEINLPSPDPEPSCSIYDDDVLIRRYPEVFERFKDGYANKYCVNS